MLYELAFLGYTLSLWHGKSITTHCLSLPFVKKLFLSAYWDSYGACYKQYFPGGHQPVQDVQNFEQTFLQSSELITFFILYSSAWRIFDNILHMIIRCMPSKGAHSYIWLCLNISHVYSMASEFWRSWFLCLVQVLIAFFIWKPPFVKHRDAFKITENYELKLKS